MPDLHSLPTGWYPEKAIRNNGPDELAIERYKCRELAEGWPLYRDSCEWENFESIFFPEAWVYTTWTGRIQIKDFILLSQAGMDKGAFIMHRVHGSTTDIQGNRAITKMKATITQRFVIDECEVDAEADCRFCFFFEKRGDRWGAVFVRHWYEKDKLIPVNPNKVPYLDNAKLSTLPSGYRYLAYCQESLGIKVKLDMPSHRREGPETVNGFQHDRLYLLAKAWLDGEQIEV